MYNDIIMEHFRHPKNQGVIKDADAVGEAGNPQCGDVMKLYLKIKKVGKKEIIDKIKFETLGCAVAIANTSVLTEMVKGKTLNEALRVNRVAMIKALGGDVPPAKQHCSLLAEEALKVAIKNYRNRSGRAMSCPTAKRPRKNK